MKQSNLYYFTFSYFVFMSIHLYGAEIIETFFLNHYVFKVMVKMMVKVLLDLVDHEIIILMNLFSLIFLQWFNLLLNELVCSFFPLVSSLIFSLFLHSLLQLLLLHFKMLIFIAAIVFIFSFFLLKINDLLGFHIPNSIKIIFGYYFKYKIKLFEWLFYHFEKDAFLCGLQRFLKFLSQYLKYFLMAIKIL